jgi:GDP-L-fucose synthase
MIKKIENAKKKGNKFVKLLGSGKPLREFLHSDDLASAIFLSLEIKKKILEKKFNNKLPILNVGTKNHISIKKLSKLIARYINFKGKIIFDKNSPDGTYKKNLDSSKINRLGWSPKINFYKGLKQVIRSRMN